MLISLVICTRNRCSSLQACLGYISRLQCPGEWELVVVDNGSTDGTAEVLKTFASTASFRVVLVYEVKPGLGRSRNAGIAKASGAIIVFTDDDCYVSRDFLKRVVEVFADEKIGFMGGRILLYDAADAPITIQPQTEIHIIEPYSFVPAGALQGANMAMRSSLLKKIGGFDSSLGAGTPFACEDVDLQSRASQSGATGIYHPGPLVWHHHGRKSSKDVEALRRRYDYARGAYYAKFILNRSTRGLFLRNWYWLAATQLHNRNFVSVLREILGAMHYGLAKLSPQRTEPVFPSEMAPR